MSVTLPNQAAAETNNNTKTCQAMYDKFKKLEEVKFIEKYKKKPFLNDCLKLYKNPNWYFVGKSKLDKYYEQLKVMEDAKQKPPQLEVLWKKFSGNNKYLVKYKICTNGQMVLQPTIHVNSRAGGFLAVSYNSIPSSSCKTYQVEAKAISANDISLKYVQNTKDPALRGIKIVNLEKTRS